MIVKILLVLFQTVLWHCNHLSQGPNPGDGRECYAIVHVKWSPGFVIIPITPRSRARVVLTALGTVSREKKSRNPNPKWPQIISRRSRWWEAVLPPCKRKTVLVKKGGRWNIKARHELRVTTDHEIRDTCFLHVLPFWFRTLPWYRMQARPTVLYRGTTEPMGAPKNGRRPY